MSDQSTNLALPFLTAAQAQKHVTVNESLLRLDALVQAAVVSATLTSQPGAPSDGALYLLPPGKTGAAWSAMADNALAYYRDGVWEPLTPRAGFRVWVRDRNHLASYDGVAWRPDRERLSAARTYFVRADGSDLNDGLANTAGGAFATIGQALRTVRDGVDLNGFAVLIQIGAGTYVEAVTLAEPWIGSGEVTLRGDVATPANVTWRTSSAADVRALKGGARLNLEGFTLDSPGGGALLHVTDGALLKLSGAMAFGATSGAHIHGERGGCVVLGADYTIAGGAASHWRTDAQSAVQAGAITVTLVGTPAFGSAFATATQCATQDVAGVTFGGSATGQRHDVATNAVIVRGGVALPGSSAGTTATGGQFV